MLSKIQQIKSFGVFTDFQWPQGLYDFKKYNLIYGWNYSGKTTLSRIIQCFEYKSAHEDFPSAQIQLQDTNGVTYQLTNQQLQLEIRVFNSDFVRKNLSFTDCITEPILILGAEDIQKQEILKSKKSERETIRLCIESWEQEKIAKDEVIGNALTRYARDFIKIPLSEVNYDKRKFEPIVNECKTSYEQFILDDNAIATYLAIYISKDKKVKLEPEILSISSLSQLKKNADALLNRAVTTKNHIQRLKDNPVVENWVNNGRPLHAGKDICQFCGQLLPKDLMAHLLEHFSVDYDDLMKELGILSGKIKTALRETITLNHKNDYYLELSERVIHEQNAIDDALKERKSALARLDTAIQEKLTKAFTIIECPFIDDTTDKIITAIETINKIVVAHNNRTDEFDKNRQDAFSKLEKHYAALFIKNEKYVESLNLIDSLKTAIKDKAEKLKELDNEIRTLEEETSEAAKGAEQINRLLTAYFGRNDLRIEVSPKRQFKIIRGNTIAKNLSEGEKTAIAFAYFITRIHDGRHQLADMMIVIDDPISSLDATHIFNTYALIKTQLADCLQLFILTHNFEFYNLIRDWGSDNKNLWNIFLVTKNDVGEATLDIIPKELMNFKSEYHYLFSILYKFNKTTTEQFDRLFVLPNITRRFMEMFGGIMIPLPIGLRKKFERIFSDDIMRERVWNFINVYSHGKGITHSLAIPDISECRTVIQACLNAIQGWDADYYADLEEAIS